MSKAMLQAGRVGLLASLGAGLMVAGLNSVGASVLALERVSVTSAGVQSNNVSDYSDISADGNLIVFNTVADNLVPNDTNGVSDIFLHNRTTGETTRVSVASDGSQANGLSIEPAISGNGRFVAFRSEASNLISDVPELQRNGIYVHDLQTGNTDKVDRNSLEEPANGISPSISDDGRFVSFSAIGIPGEEGQNLNFQVYVRDRVAGNTVRASNGPASAFANSHCFNSELSGNGQVVAFDSNADNLVANDTNGTADIFVVTLASGVTERADVSSQGAQGSVLGGSFSPRVDASGRFVVFASNHPNIVDGDTNGAIDVFLRDRQAGATTRISVSETGGQTTLGNVEPDISGNGRYVLFNCLTDELVAGDTNLKSDILVKDLQTGQLELVSTAPGGTQSNDNSGLARLNHEGDVVCFRSGADNLVLNDTNLSFDIFVVEARNQEPIANAGPDQVLGIARDGDPKTNTAAAILDGGDSSDPDGDPLSFEWKNSKGQVIGNTETVNLNLTAGMYTFTLKVTDPDGASSEDEVEITVEQEPNGMPTAAAGRDRTVKAKKKTANVRLDGRDSTDPDKDKLTFVWREGKTQLATGATPQVKLKKGRHVITLTVTDVYGTSDDDEVVINVKKKR